MFALSAMLFGCASRGMPVQRKLLLRWERVKRWVCKWRKFCLKFHEPCLLADTDIVLIDWNRKFQPWISVTCWFCGISLIDWNWLPSEWSGVFHLASQWCRLQKVRFVSDAFRPCKSRNACVTEVVAEVGESETMCVQMKKVLPEISRTILADGHGFSFNWLKSQVSTLNFCNLLILRDKFNWLKPVD